MMRRPFRHGLLALLLTPALALPAGAASGAKERAIEQIPELMGRILDSQEEIRERENALAPRLAGYDDAMRDARGRIEQSASETNATEALVDYVEAYAGRLDEQHAGLLGIQSTVVRMRADARSLRRVAEQAGADGETPQDRQVFFQDHFQGVASATRELATRLSREEEASTTGAVLQAGWASHGALELPLPEFGAEGAETFARKVEGLYARFQARSNQLRAERRAVRRLLDVLIERQLAKRLDTLFSGADGIGLGALLSGDGHSDGFAELGDLVGRTLGLPSGETGIAARETASLDRLDYFASGSHRD